MISVRKLLKMARKWRKFAATQRKRISLPRNTEDADMETCSGSTAVGKGHFVVYTADGRRFVIPLTYLNNETFSQLLQMSEKEFGLPSRGPIILPCNALFVEHIISLIRRGVAVEFQKALLPSVARTRCSSSSLHHGWRTEQPFVC